MLNVSVLITFIIFILFASVISTSIHRRVNNSHHMNIKKDNVCKIIPKDLGMLKVCAKMVLRLIKDDQKEHRVLVCQDIIVRLQSESDLFCRFITGDETDFCVRSGNQTLERLVEESKSVKVKS